MLIFFCIIVSESLSISTLIFVWDHRSNICQDPILIFVRIRWTYFKDFLKTFSSGKTPKDYVDANATSRYGVHMRRFAPNNADGL